ncbi:MAG: winged helix-turn-helix domain-containing protein [Candidatus Methylomirabilota bacterium]
MPTHASLPDDRDPAALERRRRAAARELQRGVSQAEVARKYAVSRQSVHRWAAALARAGPAALRARTATGRPPKLPRAQLAALPVLLQQGATAHGFETDLWTTARIATLITRRWGVRYDRDHVCRLLHTLGFSWQRPARRARERDEATVRRWLRTTWPRVKKNARGRRSSSGTSRASR